MRAVGNTLILATVATVIGFTFGTFFGFVAGHFRGSPLDKVASLVSVLGVSVPHYWLGMVLVIIFSVELNWLPPTGAGPDGSAAWRPDAEHLRGARARYRRVGLNGVSRSWNNWTVPTLTKISLTNTGATIMGSTADKAHGLANEAMGKAKQGIGNAVGSDKLKTEGAAQELKGDAQKATGDAKAAVKDAANKAAGAVNKNL